jgi:hypothetical protein
MIGSHWKPTEEILGYLEGKDRSTQICGVLLTDDNPSPPDIVGTPRSTYERRDCRLWRAWPTPLICVEPKR